MGARTQPAGNLRVVPFTTEPQWIKVFVDLPHRLYRNDPRWMPPMRRTVQQQLAADSPYRCHVRIRNFLVFRDDRPVARASAIVNPEVQVEGGPLGFVGFFDSEEDYPVARLVLDNALQWLTGQGVQVVRGPVDIDPWNNFRFLTSGFDEEPVILEPYNKAYYPEFFLRYGFRVHTTYFTRRITDMDGLIQRLEPTRRRCARQGYGIRFFNPRKWQEEVRTLYNLSLEIFQEGWDRTPITADDYINMNGSVFRLAGIIADPELILFGVNPEGREVGFGFGFPNFAPALRSTDGRTDPLSMLRFLYHRRGVSTITFKSIGLLPEYRRTALGSALVYEGYVRGRAKGYTSTYHSLTRTGNVSGGFAGGLGTTTREFALYEWRP